MIEIILHNSGVIFSESWNFYQLKRGGLVSGGTDFAESLNCLVPLLYSNLKSFLNPNSSSFIRFQCILHDSGLLCAESSNFAKLKSGDPISEGNKFWRSSELFGPLPFCISILKVLWIQINRHSLDLNAFITIQEYISQGVEISTN